MSVTLPVRRRGRPSLSDPSPVIIEDCLDRALEAFAERGYDGATVRQIAAASGVSHSLLNARFGSKEDLWMAAVDHGLKRLNRRMIASQTNLPPDVSLEQRLHVACVDFIETLAAFPAIVQLMNIEGARESDRLDYIVNSLLRGAEWPLVDILDEGMRTGLFRTMPIAVPFTMLAHGAGALVALRPLIEASYKELQFDQNARSRMIEDAAGLIVRGMKA